MKKKICAALILFSTPYFSQAKSQIEVKVEHALAPVHGYDDNDQVHVVIDAQLPNACYTQGNGEAKVDIPKKTIRIIQWAHLKHDGPCADPAKLPVDLKASVPFTNEVSLGQLPQGNYKMIFAGIDGVRERPLVIGRSPTTTVDSLRYATVVNAFVKDYIMAAEKEIEIRLTLHLPTSCSHVVNPIKVNVEDGVITVLPEISVNEHETCLPVSRATYKVLTIRNPGPGRYLLHVRSLGGYAKNKLFSIIVTY